MRIPTRARRYGLRFDLTPLNDIVFLLIIFLVASPHFTSQEEAGDPVELAKIPKSESDPSETDRRLEITVRENGDVRIGNRTVTPQELQQQIQQAGNRQSQQADSLEVRLRLDSRTTYDKVEPILLECAKAKITDVKFAVLPEE
ncbi:MAG: biopolymer transporter ExbD [Planctomycetaceae bacterium]